MTTPTLPPTLTNATDTPPARHRRASPMERRWLPESITSATRGEETSNPCSRSADASTSATVGRFIRDALADVHAYMHEQHIHPSGPPFARRRPTGASTVDIETGWPLERPAEGRGRIHGASLPTTLIRHATPRRAANETTNRPTPDAEPRSCRHGQAEIHAVLSCHDE